MRSKTFLLLLAAAIGTSSLKAQGIKSNLRSGKKHYINKDYKGSEQQYRRALVKDSLSGKANFGLSSSIFAQKRYDEAKTYLERAKEDSRLSPQQQASVMHNLGNVAMMKKDYQAAVEAYEEALLRDPSRAGSRYNLALAQKLLQQNKSQNQQQSQRDKQDQQQQNKQQDKQDQQQNQDKKQDKQPPKPQQEKKSQGNPNEQRQGQMSKEQAEQLLQSFRNDDDRTRRKVEQRRQIKQNSDKQKKRW